MLVHIHVVFKQTSTIYGIAVPKTTETRGRDGSVQARHVIQRLHASCAMRFLGRTIFEPKKNDVGMGSLV